MPTTMTSDQLISVIKSLNSDQLGELRTVIDHGEPLDNLWMLLGGILVFFMHAGFSMLEAGTMRERSVQSILTKNLIVICVGFMMWYFVGFGFAFGETGGEFIGTSHFFGTGLHGTNLMRSWFFQGAFCATASTIVSGAMAERTKIPGFIIFTIFITAFVYPCVVHWTWTSVGFLNNEHGSFVSETTYRDFAGSGIVHMTGGVAGIVGAAIVKPRLGWGQANESFDPHNIPLVVLGTLILWFGWYGFNGASTLAMNSSGDAFASALVSINTTLSPCIAGMTLFLLRWKVVHPRRKDVCGLCNGILAGLVSITAGCGTVAPWEALIIGFIGTFVYQGASSLLKKIGIDDPIDAFAVHGACGFWGVIALGFFGDEKETGGNGLFHGGNQLGIQLVGALCIILWVALLSFPVLFGLKVAGLLRVDEETEKEGLDAREHSPSRGYTHKTEETRKTAEDNKPV